MDKAAYPTRCPVSDTMTINGIALVWTCPECMQALNGAYSILIEVLGAELARYIHHSTPIHDLQTNALKRETS